MNSDGRSLGSSGTQAKSRISDTAFGDPVKSVADALASASLLPASTPSSTINTPTPLDQNTGSAQAGADNTTGNGSTTEEEMELPIAKDLAHEHFLVPDFNPSDFLLSRKHINLDDLRSELRSYLSELRIQLHAIINEDYEDFINLGGSNLLGSTNPSSTISGGGPQQEQEENHLSYRMRKPIENITKEIKSSKSDLEDIRNNFETKLAKRDIVRERKKVCKKLLGVNEQIAKVEEMLLISVETSLLSPNAANGQEAADQATKAGLKVAGSIVPRRRPSAIPKVVDRSMGSDTKRLERIAQEYNQLLYLVRKSEKLRFVESLQPRIDRISQTLQQDLSSLLSSTIATLHAPIPANATIQSHKQDLLKKQETLTEIFRTYSSIDKYREAEEVVRKHIVIDFMNKTIHREALLSPQSPMMPITPLPAGTSSISSALSNAGGSSGSFPFAPVSSFTAVIDDKSSIPPFYHIDPISASTATRIAHTGDSFISDALIDLYNKILLFISKDLGLILEITERRPAQGSSSVNPNSSGMGNLSRDAISFAITDGDRTIPNSPSTREKPSANTSTKSGYEILSNVVWNEVSTRLMNELSHLIFSAGRPDTFQKNYLATLAFITKIEGLCPSYKYLAILRNNPNYVTFMMRWQLPVYYQLRFKEIVGGLENILSINTVSPAPSAIQSTSLLMASSEAVYKAIVSCWSPDIYLTDLAGRFWRLTLQLVSRFRTWIDSNLPDYILPVPGPAQASSLPSNGSAMNLQRLLPNALGTSASIRPNSPNQPSSVSDETSDENVLRQLSIVISDTLKFSQLVSQYFESAIAPKLPKHGNPGSNIPDNEDDTMPGNILKDALDSVLSLNPSLVNQIVNILSKRCSEPLRLVRSGASQVRANPRNFLGGGTNAGTPTKIEPSYFVANILRPAKAFFDGSGKVLDQTSKQLLMNSLFEDLASRYEAALAKMKKDGDALRRLKKGRQGFQLFGRSTSSATTDEAGVSAEDEKVKVQMAADVEAFAKDAEFLGADLEKSEALQALRGVVEDWNK